MRLAAFGFDFLPTSVLRPPSVSKVKSLPVPYCVVVTGYPDQTWGKKLGRECKTAPALRQRHPRWNALCHVAFPPEQVGFRSELTKLKESFSTGKKM